MSKYHIGDVFSFCADSNSSDAAIKFFKLEAGFGDAPTTINIKIKKIADKCGVYFDWDEYWLDCKTPMRSGRKIYVGFNQMDKILIGATLQSNN